MSDLITYKKPIKIKQKRSKKYESSIHSVRMYSDEYDLIKKVCKQLNIAPNYFIRWCCVASAKAILNNGEYNSIDVLIEGH